MADTWKLSSWKYSQDEPSKGCLRISVWSIYYIYPERLISSLLKKHKGHNEQVRLRNNWEAKKKDAEKSQSLHSVLILLKNCLIWNISVWHTAVCTQVIQNKWKIRIHHWQLDNVIVLLSYFGFWNRNLSFPLRSLESLVFFPLKVFYTLDALFTFCINFRTLSP